jgi:hypothetical protein
MATYLSRLIIFAVLSTTINVYGCETATFPISTIGTGERHGSRKEGGSNKEHIHYNP